jgi:putative DNA primase/helicase
MDETGNRRFWPVRCQPVDIAALTRDRDQLWAEADQAFRGGERWWLRDDLEAQAAEQQRERHVPDAWEEQILAWADSQRGDITMTRILNECLGHPIDRRDDRVIKRIARVLRSAGFRRKQVRRNGKHIWIYVRPVTIATSEVA